MQAILVRHLTSSKAGQIQRLILDDFDEITLGRDPSCQIIYDGHLDALVGRQHAKITRITAGGNQFWITDLNSRNGTFVNGQEIHGTARLRPGDVVQLGSGGPEFEFSIEVKAGTISLDESRITLDSPKTVSTPFPPAPAVVENKPPDEVAPVVSEPSSIPVGRRTLEMFITKAQKESRRNFYIGGGILLTIFVIVVGILVYQNGSLKQPGASDGNAADKAGHKGGNVPVATAAPTTETAEAEADAERTAWRLSVPPYMVLGSGHPGKGASDFDKPDGVFFTPEGLLLATDAKNRRVQIWNVKTGARLAEFGHGVLGGEIVDIAVTPNGTVLVTDQTLNLAYAFVPPKPGEVDEKGKPLGPYEYQFKGTRFGEQGFDKLGGIASDSRGRIYVVDAHLNDVRRFNPDFTLDKSWRFERTKPGGDTYLHGCEGIAIDEPAGNLYIASEKDAIVQVFDWETGAYRQKLVGANRDASGAPVGKHVFAGSVEGLAIAQHHLLAVDESAGHIQIFDLARPDAANTDLVNYGLSLAGRSGGYQGYFGHMPLVNFEDKTDVALQAKVKDGSIIPGQANPPGYFCSPDAIASYTDPSDSETYIAIADQCNYRLVVYRWTDISQTINSSRGIVASNPAPPAPEIPGIDRDILHPATPTPAKVATRRTSPPHHAVHPVHHQSVPVKQESKSKSKDKGSKKSKQ